jgi:hypothetical protein
MRIAGHFTESVMLAVNCDPFSRQHSGRTPYPESKKVPQHGMQIQGPVGLIAVKVDGDRQHRYLNQDEGR